MMLVTCIYANEKPLFLELAFGLRETSDTYCKSLEGPKGLTSVSSPPPMVKSKFMLKKWEVLLPTNFDWF